MSSSLDPVVLPRNPVTRAMAKGCYTCRRRRIICDNDLPTCRKCRDAGKECLGYQKPLVWVKGGVASRGKMMGRSFDDVKSPDREDPPTTFSNDSGPMPGTVGTFNRIGTASRNHSDTAQSENCDGWITTRNDTSAVDNIPSPWGLVDPLFKDISPLKRFYISHFNQNLVNYLALYSQVNNPFRNLTPLVSESPVLADSLAAMGALHYAILANLDFSPTPWSLDSTDITGSLLSPQDVEKAVITSMSRRPTSKVYEHFLGFKQRILRQLALDLGDPVMRNDTRTLAATMILALMDALESGDGAWKYHLEGAKKLLMARDHANTPPQTRGVIDWLDTFTVDGCLLIQLMGATLARPGSLSKPFYSSDMGPEVLRRLEETSWVGCPAYLLEVIFVIHAGWCSDPDPDPQPTTINFSSAFLSKGSNPLLYPAALLLHIQAFDPTAWAEAMQSCLFLQDLSMRIALATTYRDAVYLYASRVLSRPRSGTATCNSFGLPSDHAHTTNNLIQQISMIPVADPHFKCLIWPTFIAGAECRDPSQRSLLLQILSTLYYDITSVNVRNAAWVLSLMWRKQDAKRASAQRQYEEINRHLAANPSGSPSSSTFDFYDNDDFDWIQELDDSRVDWLFI